MSKKVAYTGMWLALSVVISYLIHASGSILLGRLFLPLHLVAMLAGLISGAVMGGIVGFLAPFVGFLATGVPAFPFFLFMMIEIFFYGFLTPIFYKRFKNIYLAIAFSIIVGRLVYSVTYYVLGAIVGIKLEALSAILISFAVGAPGVAIQLVLIPIIYKSLVKLTEDAHRGGI